MEMVNITTFQFHEGPIKTFKALRNRMNKRCFNSMKVRLKRFNGSIDLLALKFQFHEGPIKTPFTTPYF